MKLCSHCGWTLFDTSKACDFCGAVDAWVRACPIERLEIERQLYDLLCAATHAALAGLVDEAESLYAKARAVCRAAGRRNDDWLGRS